MKEKIKAEKFLLASKTPHDWIDRSLKVKEILTKADKIRLCLVWEDNTGFTGQDIRYARNRHPHWKEVKKKGYKERNKKRNEEFNFKDSSISYRWDVDTIRRFLQLNSKCKDRELAEEFHTTIPAIQYWRRKVSIIESMQQGSIRIILTKREIENLMMRSDRTLKKMRDELTIKPSSIKKERM